MKSLSNQSLRRKVSQVSYEEKRHTDSIMAVTISTPARAVAMVHCQQISNDKPAWGAIVDQSNSTSDTQTSRRYSFYAVIPWIIGSALFVSYVLVITGHLEYSDLLANLVIISGALLIANGAVLSRKKRNVLYDLIHREEQAPTRTIKEREFLEFKLEIMENLYSQSGSLHSGKRKQMLDEMEGIRKRIDKLPKDSKQLAQKYLASVVIDASDNTEAGTLLIVIGTLGLAAIKLVEMVVHHQ
jgi:hypothetical protein